MTEHTSDATDALAGPSALDHKEMLAEYEALRKEKDENFNELRSVERFTTIAIAGVWTWLATHRTSFDKAHYSLAWWIPVFLAIMGLVKSRVLFVHLAHISDYIRINLETKLKLGWEKSNLQARDKRERVAYWIWGLLILGTFVITLFHGDVNAEAKKEEKASTATIGLKLQANYPR